MCRKSYQFFPQNKCRLLRAFIRRFFYCYFLDPPGSPEISGYTPGVALKKGDRVPLNCRSRGGNPPATLTWYKNGERIDSSYTNIKGGSSNDYEFVAQVLLLIFYNKIISQSN